jgi:hypothetical protein
MPAPTTTKRDEAGLLGIEYCLLGNGVSKV